MSQTRRMSVVESVVSVAIGFVVAIAVQALVFPVFGIRVEIGAHLGIAAVFTVVSIVRSYCVRRLFERLR